MKYNDIIFFFMLLAVAISSVKCQNNGDVRLVQTSDDFIYEGRLEIFMNGKWGTVCSKTSNLESVADTACRQLRYKGAFNYGTVTSLDYPIASNSTPIHIGSIDCPSSASIFLSQDGVCSKNYSMHLLRCTIDESVDTSTCTHAEDIGVMCNPESITDHPYEGQIFLSPTKGKHPANVSLSSGVVRIFFYELTQIGLLCGTGFDQNAANSACRQLGYTNAHSFNASIHTDKYTKWDTGLACKSQSHSCLSGCFGKAPTNHTTCSSVVMLSCEFQLSLKSQATAGTPLQCDATLAEKCSTTHHTEQVFTVGVIIAVVVAVFVVIACIFCFTLIICCAVPGCIFYRRRKGYQVVSS